MRKSLLSRLALAWAVAAIILVGFPEPAAANGTLKVYLPVVMNDAYAPNTRVASFMSDATDAELGSLNCASWLDCRAEEYSNFWLTTSPDATIESSYSTIGKYTIKRIALFFDTSELPDNAVIIAARLRFYSNADQAGATKVHVVRTTATTPPGPSSFGAFIMSSGGSIQAGPSQWVEIKLDPAALSWIHTAGFTRLGLVHDLDLTGVGPSGFNYLTLALWEKAGKEPELVVTYVGP